MFFKMRTLSIILRNNLTLSPNCQNVKQNGIRNLAMFSNTLKHFERKLICVPPEIMYNVVADVDRYKEFVPYCMKSDVIVKTKDFDKAKLSVGFGPIQEHYNSKLTFNKPSFVRSVCTDGRLFNLLDCTWEFLPTPSPTRCVVEFNVVFEFRSVMHTRLATMFFNEIVKTMVLAFEKRALQKHKLIIRQCKRINSTNML